MHAEGWNTITRNRDSSSCGPLSSSHRVVCGREAEECITLFSFARRSRKPVAGRNTFERVLPRLAVTNYSITAALGAVGSARELLDKLPRRLREEDLRRAERVRILLKMGRESLEPLVRNINDPRFLALYNQVYRTARPENMSRLIRFGSPIATPANKKLK
jgi:hypothetical protein